MCSKCLRFLFHTFYNRCRLCVKEVVPFLTVDVIDYRSKNSNVTDENVKINQENVDLLTDNSERGILWILFIELVDLFH